MYIHRHTLLAVSYTGGLRDRRHIGKAYDYNIGEELEIRMEPVASKKIAQVNHRYARASSATIARAISEC